MDLNDLDNWYEKRGYPKIRPKNIIPVVLNNYKLSFNYYSLNRNGGAANIMPTLNEKTFGLLMELTNDELNRIEEKEGAPTNYEEISVSVKDFNGKRFDDVKTFKVVENREKKTHQPPTKYYLNLIIKNAKKYNFPELYIEDLKGIVTQ